MAEFETTFADLGLKAPILEALNDLGNPSQFRGFTKTIWVWDREQTTNILFTSVAES